MTDKAKPILKVAFIMMIGGATLLFATGISSFLPTEAVTVAFGLMLIGAGILAMSYKPKKRIPQEQTYICVKCKKELTHSQVWILHGMNIPENRVCQPCFKIHKNDPEVK